VVALDGDDISWAWPLYSKLASAFQKASIDLDVPVIWGGNWTKFRDGPHFELDRNAYP
jgi:peptidoglycan L-alanyl-D-glutamate endopeptidase CwlK